MINVENFSKKVAVKYTNVKIVDAEKPLYGDNDSSSLKADGGLELNIGSVVAVIERDEETNGADAVLEKGDIVNKEVLFSFSTGVGLNSGIASDVVPTTLKKFDALNGCDNEGITSVVLEENCTELASDAKITGINLNAGVCKGSLGLRNSVIFGEVIKRKEVDDSLGAAKTKLSKELKSLGPVRILSHNIKFEGLSSSQGGVSSLVVV